MNKPQSFEEFLMDKHADQYQGLDDEMPDDFYDWLNEELGSDEIIDFAEQWHKKEGDR